MPTTLTPAQLEDIGIPPWPKLAADFTDADLLLGNGFSMNLTTVFGYGSLFSRFLTKVAPAEQAILQACGTTNFESILADLGTTQRVNHVLGIPYASVAVLADQVREGLIRAIEESHPRKDTVNWARLQSLASQLGGFHDIFTLNYDALLYHIIMICKDRWQAGDRSGRYNDYFWNRVSDDYLKFMDFQNIWPYKHVYYLHGALFLFKSSVEGLGQIDVKLRTNSAGELLDAIASEIRSGTLPLFVSEGRSEDKRSAIARSDYLRFASDSLEAPRECLVIYGASLGDQDAHIAESVRRGTQRAAVSIYAGGKDKVALEREMYLMRARLPGVNLAFFDSTSLFQ